VSKGAVLDQAIGDAVQAFIDASRGDRRSEQDRIYYLTSEKAQLLRAPIPRRAKRVVKIDKVSG
jgi:hypothetical protein